MKGYVQIYTGTGKGKTTAALGLAVRAVGAGLRVYICQFMKSGDYSEIKALKRLSECLAESPALDGAITGAITIEQFGTGRFVRGKPAEKEFEAGRQGLARLREALISGDFDVVIAEEANVAVSCGIFSAEALCDLIDIKPPDMELVITGRGAAESLINRADLVTDMRAVKHYFENGVAARTGIEK
ncbi:MAG: cob(I)yrinic acid a,c-diamide adenosyltransferase [Thermodesulfobacteriota bacterium]|nr:cob(I)yrinic acid a,c-diamide adenosyltransferase [Thermodesulfobacteriota bacterium]